MMKQRDCRPGEWAIWKCFDDDIKERGYDEWFRIYRNLPKIDPIGLVLRHDHRASFNGEVTSLRPSSFMIVQELEWLIPNGIPYSLKEIDEWACEWTMMWDTNPIRDPVLVRIAMGLVPEPT